MGNNIKGLIAAVHSPCDRDFKINTEVIPQLTEFLINSGVQGFYVCGSTGEGPSMTIEDRKLTAEAYIKAAAGRIPVIVQIGSDSLKSAKELAIHARDTGADAIAAVAPTYFPISNVDHLIDILEEMTSEVRDFPFFYYHLPGITGLNFNMLEFLKKGEKRLSGLAGIKYSALDVHGMQSCTNYKDNKFTLLFGCDEMLTSALLAGADGAVGSTFNFAAPLYHRIIRSVQSGDLIRARELQSLSIKMVEMMSRYGLQPAMKAAMSFTGNALGPYRFPLKALSADQIKSMKQDLEDIGYFQWSKFSADEKKEALPFFRV